MEKKLLVLAANGFADQELVPLLESLTQAGVSFTVSAPKKGEITGLNGATLQAELKSKEVTLDLFDGVVITGGLAPLELRVHEEAVQVVRECFEAPHKPIFTMGLGAQVLISAKVLAGRSLTAAPAIYDDLRLAGARVLEKKSAEEAPLYSVRSEKEQELLLEFVTKVLDAKVASEPENDTEGKAKKTPKAKTSSKRKTEPASNPADGETAEDATPEEAPA